MKHGGGEIEKSGRFAQRRRRLDMNGDDRQHTAYE